MGSIQLGIQHAVGGLASKPERDLLMQDFMTVETTNFPSEGSNHTPAHHFSEFKFKNYAPIAFRYFRDLFGIQPDDFLVSRGHLVTVFSEESNRGGPGGSPLPQFLPGKNGDRCDTIPASNRRFEYLDVDVQRAVTRIIESGRQWQYLLPNR